MIFYWFSIFHMPKTIAIKGFLGSYGLDDVKKQELYENDLFT